MLCVVRFGVRELVDMLATNVFFYLSLYGSHVPCESTHQELDLFLARKRDNAIMAPFDSIDTRRPACYRCSVRHVLLVEIYL
jgi:hypothetical protein